MPETAAPAWRGSLGAWLEGDGASFRVWAPGAKSVSLEIDAAKRDRVSFPEDRAEKRPGLFSPHAMTGEADGYFFAHVPGVGAGARYRFVVDGTLTVPDPASRCQPDGVHEPSMVIDPSAYAWQVERFPGRLMRDLVVYELHVGTFTPEGTFAAAAARLPWLRALGVTAVELMPLAAFPGSRNWGYDGAALFAPAAAYGTPDDLRRFVDEAHHLGLAVLLDVVYNHFGPDGAYAAAVSQQFFSERHKSPWGAGINFDGPGSAGTRRFFIENALHWLVEYRVDGLRLDATHAIVDESRRHFLAELAGAVRAAIRDREVLLIAEDHRNLRTLIDAPAVRGFGLDGVWADDLHHVCRRLTAGDDEGYYEDFEGTLEELVETLRRGWLYAGEHAPHFGGPRGTDPAGLPLDRFVICIQNHDQTGNRALGERLHHEIDLAAYRALTAILLAAPETPLLFMGQEWAATTPFLYFTDHNPELGRLVSEGRRDEFRHFRGFTDPERRQRIPDPQAVSTFAASRLKWDEPDRPPHRHTLALYKALLARRAELAGGEISDAGAHDLAWTSAGTLYLRRTLAGGGTRLLVARAAGGGEAGLPPGPWRRILDTEDPAFAPDPAPVHTDEPATRVRFARPGAVLFDRSGGDRA